MHQVVKTPRTSTRVRPATPIIRSVSQATFEISGDGAFEQAIREAVIWMRRRNPAIPWGATEGGAFEIGGGGHAPAQAVTLQQDGARIWAASLDDPDKTVAGRTWVTEVTVAEQAGRTLFGTRLINVTRGEGSAFVPSLPGISRQIVNLLPATADQLSLTDGARRVATTDEVDELIALLDDPARQLPVLVVADALDRPLFAAPNLLAKRLAGACHVISLDAEGAWELTRRIGRQLSVFDGAARLYRSGFFSDRSDPFDHPLWIARAGSSQAERTDLLVSYVLAASITTSSKDDYPRFDAIRHFAAAEAIASRRATASDTDLSQLFEAENERLAEEYRTLRNEFDQWLDSAESDGARVEHEIAELKSDLARARSQNDSLRLALTSGRLAAMRAPLSDYSEFETWARDNLSTNIWIAPKALKEIEKHGIFDDPSTLGEALYMLDELYVPMRRTPGDDKHAAYHSRRVELRCEDEPCFKRRNDIKQFPEYQVIYQGEKYWCDEHIKWGGGTDPRKYFRIYYHWNADDQILLIGHLPSHLDNNLTN